MIDKKAVDDLAISWIVIGIGFPIISLTIWYRQVAYIIERLLSPEMGQYTIAFFIIFMFLEVLGFILSMVFRSYVGSCLRSQSKGKILLGDLISLILGIIFGLPFLLIVFIVAMLGFDITDAIYFIIIFIIWILIMWIRNRLPLLRKN
jgi:hypothetical protein